MSEALRLVASSELLRSRSVGKLTIAGIELIDKNIDESFSQGTAFPVEGLIRTYSGISSKKVNGACSSITQVDLDILSDSLTNVKKKFDVQIDMLFKAESQRIATHGNRSLSKEELRRLYGLFYQIMTEDDLRTMIRHLHLMDGYDPSHETRLTEEFRERRLGQLVHSYMYKIFAGIATKQAMTDAMLKYRTPGGLVPRLGAGLAAGAGPPPVPPGGGLGGPPPVPPGGGPFSELRNLCLVMRDILGLINFLFRQELTNRLGPIGDTQYCHSGGNMFYVMAMMLCYIHTRHYPGGVYRADPGYDPNDILDQIMFTFDMSLGAEKDCFYAYLHELMKNPIFSDLLSKITASMSDLDFLCLTSLEHLVTEQADIPEEQQNRYIMKDITYLMCGILLEHCGIGMATRRDNIALNVILPSRQPKDPIICGLFSESIRSPVEARIKGQVNAILSPYLPLLNGIKLSTNKIKILEIFLVRIKVAMENPSDDITPELRKIFGEKLDFVIGNMKSSFYCYKQCKFKNCDYYSLETFIHELNEILTTRRDDKSDKRMDRYRFFSILSYIDNHKIIDNCAPTIIKDTVDVAIKNSKLMDTLHDECEGICKDKIKEFARVAAAAGLASLAAGVPAGAVPAGVPAGAVPAGGFAGAVPAGGFAADAGAVPPGAGAVPPGAGADFSQFGSAADFSRLAAVGAVGPASAADFDAGVDFSRFGSAADFGEGGFGAAGPAADFSRLAAVGAVGNKPFLFGVGDRGGVGDKGGLCWFNLFFGIIFQFLDPTTKNKSAEGCVNTCDDIPPGPPPPGPPPPGPVPPGPPDRPMPRHVLLRRSLSQNGQLQAISENLRGILIPFDPSIFDEQLGFSLEEMMVLIRQSQQQVVPMIEWRDTIFRYIIAFLPNRLELLLGSLRNAEQLRGQVQLLSVEPLRALKAAHISEPHNPEALSTSDTRLGQDEHPLVITALSVLKAAPRAEKQALVDFQKARTKLKNAEERAKKAIESVESAQAEERELHTKGSSSSLKHHGKQAHNKTQRFQTKTRLIKEQYEQAQTAHLTAQVKAAERQVDNAKAELMRVWMVAEKEALAVAELSRERTGAARVQARQYALAASAQGMAAEAPGTVKPPMNEQHED